MTTENQFKQGQEVWVKAIISEDFTDGYAEIVIAQKSKLGTFDCYILPSEIRTTEQILTENVTPNVTPNTEPAHTRKFRKGDKVRLVERYERKPFILDQLNYRLNEIYEVAADEKDTNGTPYSVELKNPNSDYIDESFPWFYIDLVEPAPEPKYWLHESPKTYSICYKGERGETITAVLMRTDQYTLEEAEAECNRLNRKG